MKVLGIDPGLTRLGYGVVEAQGSTLSALDAGVISTPASSSIAARLALVGSKLEELMARWDPGAVALERVFLKANSATAVPSIQAAGAALLIAGKAGVEVAEYAPAEVKLAVAGTGSATKDQIKFMVNRIVGSTGNVHAPDAYDALAVAICHLNLRKWRALKEVHA